MNCRVSQSSQIPEYFIIQMRLFFLILEIERTTSMHHHIENRPKHAAFHKFEIVSDFNLKAGFGIRAKKSAFTINQSLFISGYVTYNTNKQNLANDLAKEADLP